MHYYLKKHGYADEFIDKLSNFVFSFVINHRNKFYKFKGLPVGLRVSRKIFELISFEIAKEIYALSC